MNILITGANGYIGKSLVETLQSSYNVFQIKSSLKYNRDNQIYYMNLLDNTHTELFINEKISIDVIIHVASKMASSQNVDDLNVLYDNIKMYEQLLYIVKRYKPKKLINFSSIAVYPNKDGNYDENSIIKPSVNGDALYGLSKFCGENILDYKLRNENIKIVHLRVSQVFSDDLKEDRLYLAMKNELNKTNKITVFGNGERVSNFIHKDLLINNVLFFIQNEYSGIFNIGDKNLSYKEFANYIISKFGNINSEIIFNTKGLKVKPYIKLDKFNNVKESINV